MDRWSGEEKELACLGLIWSSRDRYCESVLQTQEHWSCCDSWRVNFPFQPLDLSLNKLFKDGVRKQWMADGIHEFTDSGRQKKASKNWSVGGFRKCGKPFCQKWSLPLYWSVGSQIIWMDHKMNWFTIQLRTHRKPIWIGLQVGI